MPVEKMIAFIYNKNEWFWLNTGLVKLCLNPPTLSNQHKHSIY